MGIKVGIMDCYPIPPLIDAIVMEAVVVVEVERVVDMSTSQETQVRPVSLVASLT